MICACGDPDSAHEDKIIFRGACSLCACLMFELKIVKAPRISVCQVDELQSSELPMWQYERPK
jgi:hypothetical protein